MREAENREMQNNESKDRPQFVSYRADADSFRIRFVSGPLDGAEAVTDEFPDNDLFIHHVRGRSYVYRYVRIGMDQFEARLEGFEAPQRNEESSDGRYRFVLFALGCVAVVWLVMAMMLL